MQISRLLAGLIPSGSIQTRRFLPALFLFALAAGALIVFFEQAPAYAWLAPTLALLTAALFAVVVPLAAQRFTLSGWKQFFLYTAGLLYPCLLLLATHDAHPAVSITRFLPALLAAGALVPYFACPEPGAFHDTLTALGARALICAFYAFLVFAGISLAILSLDALFELRPGHKPFLWVWSICALFYAPALFLTTFPAPGAPGPADRRISAVLVRGILLPMALVYLLLSYAYLARILVSGRMPHGIAGTLALGFSLVAVTAHLLVSPYREENRLFRIIHRRLYPLVLPLLGLFAVAIGIRIAAYGLTETRCLVATAGIWLLVVLGHGIVTGHRNPRFMFLSLAVIASLSTVGPWNSTALSRASQATRLATLLRQGGYVHEDKLLPEPPAQPRNVPEIREALYYLDSRGALPELARHVAIDHKPVTRSFLEKRLGLLPGTAQHETVNFRVDTAPFLPVRGYDLLLVFEYFTYLGSSTTVRLPKGFEIIFFGETGLLHVTRGRTILLVADMTAHLHDLWQKNGKKTYLHLPTMQKLFTGKAGIRLLVHPQDARLGVKEENGKTRFVVEGLRARLLLQTGQ